MTSTRINKLDGLRGLFSVAVVLYHYPVEYLPDVIAKFFVIRESFVFVDFFFILSGFVISMNYNYMTDIKEFSVYMKKRIARLYPLLFWSTSVFLIFAISYYYLSKVIFTVQADVSPFSISEHLINPIIKYLETLLCLNSLPLISTSGGFGMNGPSWSISAEMISYLCFGFCTIKFGTRKKNTALMCLIILSYLILYYHGEYFSTGQMGFLRGIVGFNLGYFVWFYNQESTFKFPDILEVCIPILLMFGLFLLHELPKDSITYLFYSMFGIPLLFGLLIFVFLNTDGIISKLLETKPFQFLGNVSYSIYLNHSLFVTIIVPTLFKITYIEKTIFNVSVVFLMTIMSILLYSSFTYVYIEKRLGVKLRATLLK